MTFVSGGRYVHSSSAANAVVKLMRGLQRKKDRRVQGVFLVSGVQLVREAIERQWQVRHVLISGENVDTAAGRLANSVYGSGGRVTVVPPSVLESVTRDDGRQSIAAAVVERHQRLRDLETGGCRRWLACYEVRDPGNLGSLLRTSYAALVDGVILIGRCCDPYCEISIRASMGAIFALPVVRVSVEEFVRWKTSLGALVTGALVGGDGRLDDLGASRKSILLLGNERSGLPRCLAVQCDQKIRIPMRSGFHSLNLANAGSIMIYALWRVGGYAGGD